MEIEIIKKANSGLKEVDFLNLQFGSTFSDHMVDMEYRQGKWHNPRIKPYGPLQAYPSLSALHYGQAVFEGLKAFYTPSGKINLFRPEKHLERLNKSSERLCIPEIKKDIFINSLLELIRLDQEWVPRHKGCSLYIRPFIFADENFLGVKTSDSFSYMVITCPVGSYYKEGMNPIRLTTSGEFVRAVRGGLGEAKTPANYAGSIYPAHKAKERGFTQVLWLDGLEKKYIEEVGTTNIFFLIGDELVTPPLDGTILNGVTRDSVISIASHLGVKVTERKITIDELFGFSESGELREAFGTGTAAVISPVGEIDHLGKNIIINQGKTGELSKRLYDEITAIQYGEKADIFNWCMEV